MGEYECLVCHKKIKNFKDGNFVKIKDSKGKVLKVVSVHQGACDDALCEAGKMKGLNTNSSMPISSFDTEKERKEYLNGSFAITNEELYQKLFDEDGMLKPF